MLPKDLCKKHPCNFNSCPTLGQLLASRILYTLLVGEKQHEIARARFCTQSCSKVGQLLVNSSPTPHPTGSCRGLPCSSLDTFSSATDSHPSQAAHLTEHLARGRFCVDSWSTFRQFWLKMTTSDRKPTKNQLKIDPLQDLNRSSTPKKREGLWLKSKCLQ